MSLEDRLSEIRSAIAEIGVDPDRVEIVAVTKGFGPDAVAQATAAGLAVGENYAQEMMSKVGDPEVRWHFLGPIQRNKIASLGPHVDVWHGLARIVEAEAMAQHAATPRAFVQVDLTGRGDRGGCPVDAVQEVVEGSLAAGVDVVGLMTVAPQEDPAPAFRVVAEEARRLGLSELSMGMSGDFRLAVAEGATMIRLGTALFGPRPTTSAVRR